MSKKNLWIALAIYVISAVMSYSAFSYMADDGSLIANNSKEELVKETLLSTLLDIDPNEAKDQECPLTGALYTTTEKNAWEARRPLYVMIENSPDARPQSGMSKADIIFEAVAEGGVTRFGALYYCAAQYQDVVLAPVRSARSYFVDWASGFNLPMYVHVGGANVPGPTNSLGQIGDYGWEGENDINQFSVGYPTFIRDYNRVPGKELATEHTMVSTTEALWDLSLDREWTNITPARTVAYKKVAAADWKDEYDGWSFEDSAAESGQVNSVSYDFWSGYNQYSVEWTYDLALDAYLRKNGGEKVIDLNNDQQIASSTVIVLLTSEKGPINEKKHMIYGTIGKGKALIFKHGQEPIEANWAKASREGELSFSDIRGKEVELARGQVWISILATGSEIIY